MKRRTLDIIFSIGGAMLGVLVLMLGLVLRSNAVFAQDYVHDQLTEQRITFTPVANLSPEEQQSSGLVKYAGQPLTTGAQAQVYANDYIALHLSEVNDGKTYSETSGDARAARAAATEAKDSGAANAAELDKAGDGARSARCRPSSVARPSGGCCSPPTGSASSVTRRCSHRGCA